MDVVVEVGGWEHQCCGSAVERGQVVDLGCLRWTGEDGGIHFIESHHDLGTVEHVRGEVVDIHVVQDGGTTRPILRLPSGNALCGHDPADDGHLEDARTGEVVSTDSEDFLVTVRTPGPRVTG